MTTVTFATRGSRIEKVTLEGHSGLAPAGEDVLCAALTSAIRLTETVINDVCGAAAPVRVRDASISLKLPGDLGVESESVCQAALTGLMVYLSDLAVEYPENLTVLDMEV